MLKNRSAPSAAVIPVLVYNDVRQAMNWLCGAFGFTVRLSIGDPSGKVGHAQLNLGDGAIMLGAARIGQGFSSPDHAELRPPRAGEVNQYVHVRVEDVDRHYEHARQFGAKILHPPTDHPYGERQYNVEDLAGHRWTFSQSIADVAPESWGATLGSTR